MTNELYLENPYRKDVETSVLEILEPQKVVLEQTIFYPKSGGVDNDLGEIKRKAETFNVTNVYKNGEQIVHEVDREGLHQGDKITAVINWNRRYELMRSHTAAHILSGVFYKNLGAKIGGNEITVGQSRIDFSLDNFDRTIIEQQVKVANDLITQNLGVKAYYISRTALEADNSLIKLRMGISDTINQIRIVEIETFDKQPDGGCHVANLKEVGTILIGKISNKGKNNRRLYYQLI